MNKIDVKIAIILLFNLYIMKKTKILIYIEEFMKFAHIFFLF